MKVMEALQKHPLLLDEGELFSVGNSDFAHLESPTGRYQNGAVLLCRRGKAEVILDDYRGSIRRNSSMMILPGSLFSLVKRSPDFQATYFTFSPQLFAEAAFRLEIDFMRLIKTHPINHLSREGLHGMNLWLQILAFSYEDRANRFRNTIVKNRLQNALLETCDKVMRSPHFLVRSSDQTSRRNELFNRFMVLVNQHGSTCREVNFYAEQLCISTRYLSNIIHAVSGRTAKEIIDHSAIMEIKLLLQTTELSVQEIAYRLNFPDQSYLGRFFRKHTGESPTRYRANCQS